MTWEEIIIQIRKDPAYKELVELAYFEENLPVNIERFKASEEYSETLRLIAEYVKAQPVKLADIGAGNGVAAVTFALEGFHVTAVEPDPSATIGAGAIKSLKEHYHLQNLDVVEAWGESLPLQSSSFDVVYIRQAVHHAAQLDNFIKEAARLLRPGGVLLTTRDHVVYDAKDKEWFLNAHTLHKFYGGENAFTKEEYSNAILKAGLNIKHCYGHYDSVINYFPEKRVFVEGKKAERFALVNSHYERLFPGPLHKMGVLRDWYFQRAEKKLGPVFDERKIPGRLITFLAQKPL